MNHFRFFIYQFFLCGMMIAINYYILDEFVNAPFSTADLITAVIIALVLVPIYRLIDRLYEPFERIKYRVKVLLSIPAFLLAIILVGLATSELII